MSMNNAQPFRRFIAVMDAIHALAANFNNSLRSIAAQSEMRELLIKPEFQSRGKGGGHRPQCAHGMAFGQHRKARNQTGMRMIHPKDRASHNGAREIARRLGKLKRSVPQRKWCAMLPTERVFQLVSSSKRSVIARTVAQARVHYIGNAPITLA